MNRILFFILLTTPLLAQQLVIPKELNADQQKAFKRITEDISAPCCSNAIPIAYHESGMAVHLREVIAEKLAAGLSERQVKKEIMALELGPEKKHPISATPDASGVNIIAWFAPFVVALLMIGFILMRRSKDDVVMDENELIEQYRGAILKQLGRAGGVD